MQDDRFISTRLPDDYQYNFAEQFEELNFMAKDGGQINALLFTTDSSRGVVCFWKGNGGTLDRWGKMAPQFLKYNYDIIFTDYREHGKSKGTITLNNFYSDAQTVYDFLKIRYPEDKIVVVGYSLGTFIASRLSAMNNPSTTLLIEPREKFVNKYLEALFSPLPDINRFQFRTDLDIQRSETPVIVITGTRSDLYRDAINLKKSLDRNDRFFEIEGADHRSILGRDELDSILALVLME